MDGSVAIHWWQSDDSPSVEEIHAGRGVVAIKRGNICVVGVYIPPKRPAADAAFYKRYLEGVDVCLQACRQKDSPLHVVLAGDFNAHSQAWGCAPGQCDDRGGVLVEWAGAHGLHLATRRGPVEATFVGARGRSVIDLTWTSAPLLSRVVDWAVDVNAETLSDHRYITWSVSPLTAQMRPEGGNRKAPLPRRWALTKWDPDRFVAAILAGALALKTEQGARELGIEEESQAIVNVVVSACDASMPRSRPRQIRAAYWWTQEIAKLRAISVRAARKWESALRSGDEDGAARAKEVLLDKREDLKAAMADAKRKAYEEFLNSLNENPWGRPYKIAVGKLRRWTPPPTETLDRVKLRAVLDGLFPRKSGAPPVLRVPAKGPEEEEEHPVEDWEFRRAVERLGAKNKAPGPDGVPGRAWALALASSEDLSGSFQRLLGRCCKEGRFPPAWRRAKLVLLPKEGKEPGQPNAYRPICLLDEAGKFFERIIALRLVQHLEREGPNLHDQQYGFRGGRSTIDAIMRVRALSRKVVEGQGGVMLAISLDIKNAFNTLPWDEVGEALDYHNAPPYLRRVIRDYFRNRGLTYPMKGGAIGRRTMYCGVPQGSVLGPLLWNLAYDRVLRSALPLGCNVVCYADDTLVTAEGQSWGEARTTGEIAVTTVVAAIKELGLRVAPQKTEAVFFHDGKKGAPPSRGILVDGVRVPVEADFKYLGLQLDGKWSFRSHFKKLAPKVGKFSMAIAGLMPNLGGPKWRVRRLYMNVVASVALYGAPVWAGALTAAEHNIRLLRKAARPAAVRAARCYRTVANEAVNLLAGLPPLEFLARQHAEVYTRIKELREEGRHVTPAEWCGLRTRAKRRAVSLWFQRLKDRALYGRRVIDAIRPCLREWTDRRGCGLTFRTVQVLTGHGCFGEYLHRIKREDSAKCWHCPADRDTADHTLKECPAWASQRRVLVDQIGEDLSLSRIIEKILESDENYKAWASFCEQVMSRKEADEHIRRVGRGQDVELKRPRPRRRRQGGDRTRAGGNEPPTVVAGTDEERGGITPPRHRLRRGEGREGRPRKRAAPPSQGKGTGGARVRRRRIKSSSPSSHEERRSGGEGKIPPPPPSSKKVKGGRTQTGPPQEDPAVPGTSTGITRSVATEEYEQRILRPRPPRARLKEGTGGRLPGRQLRSGRTSWLINAILDPL